MGGLRSDHLAFLLSKGTEAPLTGAVSKATQNILTGTCTTRFLLSVTCPWNPPSLHPEVSSEHFSSTKKHRQEPVSQQLHPGAHPLTPSLTCKVGLSGPHGLQPE